MKKLLRITLPAILIIAVALSLASCFNTVDNTGVWENATYRRDMEFGRGEKTVQVEVKAGEDAVTFTIHTDEKYLGDALKAHNLIEGEEGDYGLYVKKVNGILADYSVDQTYWAVYKSGEYMLVGVDSLEIADGEHYELSREK